MNEPLDLNIYYSELDFQFVKKCLKWVLKASEEFNKEYGQGYAAKCIFRGAPGKYAFDEFKTRNYNVGMALSYEDGDDCMVVSKGKPITVKKQHGYGTGNSLDGLMVPGMVMVPPEALSSFNFTVEREIDAEIIVKFIKI